MDFIKQLFCLKSAFKTGHTTCSAQLAVNGKEQVSFTCFVLKDPPVIMLAARRLERHLATFQAIRYS